MVEIEGVDINACGGTHTASLAELQVMFAPQCLMSVRSARLDAQRVFWCWAVMSCCSGRELQSILPCEWVSLATLICTHASAIAAPLNDSCGYPRC